MASLPPFLDPLGYFGMGAPEVAEEAWRNRETLLPLLTGKEGLLGTGVPLDARTVKGGAGPNNSPWHYGASNQRPNEGGKGDMALKAPVAPPSGMTLAGPEYIGLPSGQLLHQGLTDDFGALQRDRNSSVAPQDFGERGKNSRAGIPGGFYRPDGPRPGDADFIPELAQDQNRQSEPQAQVSPTPDYPEPEYLGIGAKDLTGGDVGITPTTPVEAGEDTEGSWDKFMKRPGMGLALLRAGAAIMGGKTPLEGLAAGADTFGVSLEDRRRYDEKRGDDNMDRMIALRQAQAKLDTKETSSEKLKGRMAAAREMGLEPGSQEYVRFVGGQDPYGKGGRSSTLTSNQAANAYGALTAANETITRMNDIETLINGGVYEGLTADAAAFLSTKVPWFSDVLTRNGVLDRDTGLRTLEWQNIMSQEAITAMASSLKGATTNFELEEFKRILADPSAPKEIKLQVARRMKQVAKRAIEMNNMLLDENISEDKKRAILREMAENAAKNEGRPQFYYGSKKQPTPATDDYDEETKSLLDQYAPTR